MRTTFTWREQARRLTLALAPGSRMMQPAPRRYGVRIAGSDAKVRPLEFNGRAVSVVL
jgi:hypothetical protein